MTKLYVFSLHLLAAILGLQHDGSGGWSASLALRVGLLVRAPGKNGNESRKIHQNYFLMEIAWKQLQCEKIFANF